MNEYKNRRQLLCLAVTVGMMFTAVNVSSKTVWAAAEQVIEYDPNQEEKTHPGSIILKQNLKEEDLPSLKQPEASYTDENGIHYRLADWEVRELPEASRSRMLEKTEVYREVEGQRRFRPMWTAGRRKMAQRYQDGCICRRVGYWGRSGERIFRRL